MSEARRQHWDPRYREGGVAPILQVPPPLPALARFDHLFPTRGQVLEIACGRGRGAVWLASRGMTYWGVDVSAAAIDLARLTGVNYFCRWTTTISAGVVDSPTWKREGASIGSVLHFLFFFRAGGPSGAAPFACS